MNVLNSGITSFYYPTNVVFLDDNQGFLDAISLEFSEQENILMFTNTDKALQHIRSSNKKMMRHPGFEFEDNPDINNKTRIKKSNIIDMIYDPSRYSAVSVLVVDYLMPTINGVEFCKQLGENSIYKILVTAETDKDIAINAFNEGIIDKFILKTEGNLFEQVKLYINELTNKYFMNFSEYSLTNYNESLRSLLKNELYKELFYSVATQSNAVEYYLVDQSGSFLFLNKYGEPTWLLISDQENVKNQVDLLNDYCFPEELINKIETREELLFLFSENEYKEELENWRKYIFNSRKIDNNYSYSVVSGNLTNSINWQLVNSYHSGVKPTSLK